VLIIDKRIGLFFTEYSLKVLTVPYGLVSQVRLILSSLTSLEDPECEREK